ncbi:unnamed protein product, partial [Didymodactylos carnosus]
RRVGLSTSTIRRSVDKTVEDDDDEEDIYPLFRRGRLFRGRALGRTSYRHINVNEPDISNNDIHVDLYRAPTDQIILDAVMYNDENLLDTSASSCKDFAERVLSKLYTRDELAYSVLPTGRTCYSRLPLDPERFKIFH